jgi:hypothetical protein
MELIPMILIFLTGMGAGVFLWWLADTLESRSYDFPSFDHYPDVTPTDEDR